MITKYKKRFELFEKYKKSMPGIATGLELLNILKLKNQDLVESSSTEQKVKFYDNLSEEFKYYDFTALNNNLIQLYEDEIIYRKVIIYNKLYVVITNSFNEYIKNYNFTYKNNMFNCYSIINNMFKSLRLNFDKKSKEFLVENFLLEFNNKYFDPEISTEQFYDFLLGFLSYLEHLEVLIFNSKKLIIKFNECYNKDLERAMFCSFDLMLLGDNNIYKVLKTDSILFEQNMQHIYKIYNDSEDIVKMYLDDVLKCFVIISTVDLINIYPEMNNLLVELIFNNFEIRI